MNDVELRQLLTEKLAILSADNLNLVGQFIDKLTHQEEANKSDNYLTEKALQTWQFLVKNNQEMDNTNPLSENEIKIIWQFLSQSHISNSDGKRVIFGVTNGDCTNGSTHRNTFSNGKGFIGDNRRLIDGSCKFKGTDINCSTVNARVADDIKGYCFGDVAIAI
ncbi:MULTISPECIES: hypothetical protein [unclassified Microcystis]|uniref:hypothetical protein n=1 Tax=unclassified Microcystis TaxID=2643300 RepID=UPI00257A43A7|nr:MULTISPECIES: hypothetical protein [unclassified Microcystis]